MKPRHHEAVNEEAEKVEKVRKFCTLYISQHFFSVLSSIRRSYGVVERMKDFKPELQF